jgi:outer membrane protein W
MPDPNAFVRPRARLAVLLGCLVHLAIASGAAADSVGRWTIGLEGSLLSPQGDRAAFAAPGEAEGTATFGIDGDGSGWGIGVEYGFTRRLAVELAVSSFDLDARVEIGSGAGPGASTIESTSFEVFLLGLDWHPMPDRRLDWSLGAFVAQSKLDDVVVAAGAPGPGKLTFDDDHGFGVKLGLGWTLGPGSRWKVTGELRYLQTILETDSAAADLDLDPVIFSLGFAYRLGGG